MIYDGRLHCVRAVEIVSWSAFSFYTLISTIYNTPEDYLRVLMGHPFSSNFTVNSLNPVKVFSLCSAIRLSTKNISISSDNYLV